MTDAACTVARPHLRSNLTPLAGLLLVAANWQTTEAQAQVSPPLNVSVEQNGTVITLSWELDPEASRYVVYHYRFDLESWLECGEETVFLRSNGDFPWSACEPLAKPLSPRPTEGRFVHRAPRGGNAYWVAACYDDSPVETTCSETETAARPIYTVPPNSPFLRIVDRTEDSLTLDWSASRAARFELSRRRDGVGGFEVIASLENHEYDPDYELTVTSQAHSDGGLAADATYYYKLKACNTVGCSRFSATAGGITEAVGPVGSPPTPTGFRGREVKLRLARNRARLSWNPAPGATYYLVHQGGSPSVANVSAPGSQYTDSTPNTRTLGTRMATTSYWVQACNKAGCSSPSEPVSVGG